MLREAWKRKSVLRNTGVLRYVVLWALHGTMRMGNQSPVGVVLLLMYSHFSGVRARDQGVCSSATHGIESVSPVGNNNHISQPI